MKLFFIGVILIVVFLFIYSFLHSGTTKLNQSINLECKKLEEKQQKIECVFYTKDDFLNFCKEIYVHDDVRKMTLEGRKEIFYEKEQINSILQK